MDILRKRTAGVTLLEVLFVVLIAGTIVVMLMRVMQQQTAEMRRSRVQLQIQQLITASVTYYTANNRWPTNLDQLSTNNYLPPSAITIKNPWGNTFRIWADPYTFGMLYIVTNVGTSQDAQFVANKLPLAFVSDATGSALTPPTQGSCTSALSAGCTYVIASVNVPAQNLNKARAVKFASVYHSGGCVPVPQCPGAMQAQIYVVPVEVYGMTIAPTSTGNNVSPLNHFVGFALGPQNLGSTRNMPSCNGTAPPAPCKDRFFGQEITSGNYWRVCLGIQTEDGLSYYAPPVSTVMAITRCIPANTSGNIVEPQGSSFHVWWY
jgi:type II secretory pathway pseudopilin PulG